MSPKRLALLFDGLYGLLSVGHGLADVQPWVWGLGTEVEGLGLKDMVSGFKVYGLRLSA